MVNAPISGRVLPLLLLLVSVAALPGCATKRYSYQSIDEVPFLERALTQEKKSARVRVAVPTPDEARAIFGVPMYKRKIQPVWVEVENRSAESLRFAPVGVDRNYFAPLEVPYMHRGGYSKKALDEMNARFYALAMPRVIPQGTTRSGFVFTNLRPGTKGVNVDLFAIDSDESFAFFVDVPGFMADHAEVDFDALYAEDEIRNTDLAGLREALSELPCCTTNQQGDEAGAPFTVVMVGEGTDVLHALLRARWYEILRPADEAVAAASHHYFGRRPDAAFRRTRSGPGGAFGNQDRSELRIWLAPIRLEGMQVWTAQFAHHVGQATEIEQFFMGSRIDPDIDSGRDYMVQIMWYGQGLEKLGWLAGGTTATLDAQKQDFTGSNYFTDGYRAVMWLSGAPISTFEVESVQWDPAPVGQ